MTGTAKAMIHSPIMLRWTLLETTSDLATLEEQALKLLTVPDLAEAFRYLAAPPISIDDLKVLADTRSLAPSVLAANPAFVRRQNCFYLAKKNKIYNLLLFKFFLIFCRKK